MTGQERKTTDIMPVCVCLDVMESQMVCDCRCTGVEPDVLIMSV